MKRTLQRTLAAEKRKIERRLRNAVTVNDSGPVLSAPNLRYELAAKTKAIAAGGIGAIHRLVQHIGLAACIDAAVQVFKIHQPYHESDHVLNIAYNILCGGHTLDDIELRRTDRVFLDALGTDSLPDPTTAGDFCRRFDADRIEALMDALNETRLTVWQRCPGLTEQTARIDGDGTLVPTTGTCKEGMDIAYTGLWGYHPLVVSLANTGEPLFLKNRSGNRPSHEGVLPYFDKAIALCRRAGFTDILLRGDTDFALTRAFDRWTDAGVRFVFGYDATQTMVQWGETAPPALYTTLVRRANRALQTRARPARVKDRIVRERGFKNITTVSEAVVDFDYQPTACTRPYRVVALKKNLSVEKGEHVLFDDIRYFFYITNDTTLSCIEVVQEARQRCDQENLIAQLKGGVRALHAPVNTLHANWAYMVMASLAWSLKAWVALALPIVPRWRARHTEEQRRLLRMDFRTFLAAFVNVPCQIVTSGRRVIFRLLAWNPWQYVFFRFVAATSPAGTTEGRKEPHIHDHNPDASPVAAGPGGVRLACRGMCGTVASSLCDDLHGRAALVLGLAVRGESPASHRDSS